jgi:hypothetical protein
MALLDDIPVIEEILGGGNWMTGLAIGVGALVVLRLAAPILRPLAKTAIKGGILAYRGAAGLLEGMGDLVTEAAAESGERLPPRLWRRRRKPHERGGGTEARGCDRRNPVGGPSVQHGAMAAYA